MEKAEELIKWAREMAHKDKVDAYFGTIQVEAKKVLEMADELERLNSKVEEIEDLGWEIAESMDRNG